MGFNAEFSFETWKVAYTPRSGNTWGQVVLAGMQLSNSAGLSPLGPAPDFGKIGTAVGPACGNAGYPGDSASSIALGQSFSSDESSDFWPTGSFRIGSSTAGIWTGGDPSTQSSTHRGPQVAGTEIHFSSLAGFAGLAQTYSNPSTTNRFEISTPTCTRGETVGRWYATTFSSKVRTRALAMSYDGSSLDFAATIDATAQSVTVTPGTGEPTWGTPLSS